MYALAQKAVKYFELQLEKTFMFPSFSKVKFVDPVQRIVVSHVSQQNLPTFIWHWGQWAAEKRPN